MTSTTLIAQAGDKYGTYLYLIIIGKTGEGIDAKRWNVCIQFHRIWPLTMIMNNLMVGIWPVADLWLVMCRDVCIVPALLNIAAVFAGTPPDREVPSDHEALWPSNRTGRQTARRPERRLSSSTTIAVSPSKKTRQTLYQETLPLLIAGFLLT